jgi:hypothetical protein
MRTLAGGLAGGIDLLFVAEPMQPIVGIHAALA